MRYHLAISNLKYNFYDLEDFILEKYFVSFSIQGSYAYHTHSAEIELEEKISDIEGIRLSEGIIEEKEGFKKGTVNILNFQRFDN